VLLAAVGLGCCSEELEHETLLGSSLPSLEEHLMTVFVACGLQSPRGLAGVARSSVKDRGWETKAAVTGLTLVVSAA